MNTSLAIVTVTASGQPVSGAICYLQSPELPNGFLFAITNNDGYAIWPEVQMPFDGTLQIAGAAKFYQQNDVKVSGANVTLRCGPSPSNPQDIILPAVVPFKSGSVLPAPPSRDELCGVNCPFQGLTFQSATYGPMPMFDPAIAWPDFATDHESMFDAKIAAKGTHFNIAVSSQYDQDPARNVYAGKVGRDFTQDLGALRELIIEIICAGADRGIPTGFKILLAMAGDGMSVNDDPQPGQYNDPVGWTYGYQWLMRNFDRVWSALEGANGEGPDLTPWIVPMPGYDGVVPGWQPWQLVSEYARMVRQRIGAAAASGIELSAGYKTPSGEGNYFATEDGKTFDTILQEYPYPMGPPDLIPANLLAPPPGHNWNTMPPLTNEQRSPWDQVWQITGAMVQPFNRPADMPSNDYPGGIPFDLAGGTPRGPFFYIKWEFDTFGWVRKLCTVDQVQAHRNALTALGGDYVG